MPVPPPPVPTTVDPSSAPLVVTGADRGEATPAAATPRDCLSTQRAQTGGVNAAGPTSRIYFSQRLRLHYVDWGNPDRAAAAAGARRARPLPQLGLGGGRSCARLAHHRPRPARPRRQPVVARRHLHDGGLHLRPGPAHPSAGAGARHHRRPFARRQHRAALCRHLSRERAPSWSPSRGWARRRSSMAERAKTSLRRAHARLDRRAARRSRAACRAATPRSRTPASACRRRTSTCRPSRRATSPCTASTRTRTAPTAGSSTTTCAPGRPTT